MVNDIGLEEQRRDVRRRLALAIRQRRVQRGWSQEELARRAQLRLAMVERVESGGSGDIRIDTISALAEALGVDPADLFRPRNNTPH